MAPINLKSLIGEKHNRLIILDAYRKTVVYPARPEGRLEIWAKCYCICGTIKHIRYYDLTHKGTTSCGCYRREATAAADIRKKRWIEYKGERHRLFEWAEILKINPDTLWSRLRKHPVHIALARPKPNYPEYRIGRKRAS